MTKKDYVKIAGIVKKQLNCHCDICANCIVSIFSTLAQDLAVVFASDNPRFDQDRFLEACGL